MIRSVSVVFFLTIGNWSCDDGEIGGLSEPERERDEGNVIPTNDPPVFPGSRGVLELAVFGGSLAVGTLGDTVMGESPSLGADHPLMKVLLGGGGYHGGNFDSFYKERYENAYTYGKKEGCFSHACRMDLGTEQFVNVAVSGAKVDDLYAQLRSVSDGAKRYIIQIGVNDFLCRRLCGGRFYLRIERNNRGCIHPELEG